MVYVPGAEAYGFSLRLNEAEMSRLLNSAPVREFTRETMDDFEAQVIAHVRSTASAEAADNYVASLVRDDASSDDYGYEFNGPYALGNRPISVVGVPSGRGVNPAAMPPLMTEARTHALSSVPGFETGVGGEDVR